MATPFHLEAPKGDEYQPSFLDRVGNGLSRFWDNTPPEAFFALSKAMLTPGAPFASKLGLGLSGMGEAISANKKKQGLAAAFDQMLPTVPEAQRPILAQLVKENPEAIMGAYAGHLFDKPEQNQGPFAGTSVDSSSMNIVVRGQKDPAVRATPEYLLAWRKLTEPQVIRDASGNMSLYQPPAPQGLLPPEVVSPQARPLPTAPMPQGLPTAPSAPPSPSRGAPVPPPASVVKPDRPGVFFDPAMHPELGDGMMPPESPQSQKTPNGGTVTPLPGTSPAGTEEAKAIRQAIDTTIPAVKSQIKEYRDALTKTGWADRIVGIGAENAKASSAHTNLLLQLKELFNLGVLNGPDYTLMTKMVDPPDSTMAAMRGIKGLNAQLDEVERYIKDREKQWRDRASSLGVRGLVPGGSAPPAQTGNNDPLGIR